MGYAELLALLAQLGISVAGENRANDQKDQERKMLSRAMAEFAGLSPPDLERMTAEEQGPSAFEDVHADPEARAAQYAALDSLKGIADQGGHTLADDANLNRLRNSTAGQASSGRHRIAEDMAGRGQLNSGATLAMQLAGNEGAANRASQESMDMAAQQQRRALDAILQRGKLGGELRGQQYGEDARRAEARDMLARYNSQSRQRAQYYNAGLNQQTFDNKMRRAQGIATGGAPLANFYGNQAADTRGFYAGLGETVRRGGGAYDRFQSTEGAPSKPSDPPLVDAPDEDEWGNPYRRTY